jgi:hypothetical protein
MRRNHLFLLHFIVLSLGLCFGLSGGLVGCGGTTDDDDSADDDDDSAVGDDDDSSAGDDDDSAGGLEPEDLLGLWTGPASGTAVVQADGLEIDCAGEAILHFEWMEVVAVVGGSVTCIPIKSPMADPIDVVVLGGFTVGGPGEGDTPLGPVAVSVEFGVEPWSLDLMVSGTIIHPGVGPIDIVINSTLHKAEEPGDDDDSAADDDDSAG